MLRNHYFPSSVDSTRESVRRALDRRGTATRFGELIDKHGSRDWLEPLQLGDIANMLEVFSKSVKYSLVDEVQLADLVAHSFYHWKAPKKTAATLYFLAVCLLVSICTDMEFCMKIVSFIVGGTFFLCWPIASLYPKYRYLVSPFKWALWDIPTNGEFLSIVSRGSV